MEFEYKSDFSKLVHMLYISRVARCRITPVIFLEPSSPVVSNAERQRLSEQAYPVPYSYSELKVNNNTALQR